MKVSDNGSRVDKWKDADHFRSHVSYWAERIRVEPERVNLRPMKNKWASCSTKGSLTFSTQLLEENAEFGEYVIVHELLHLKIPNHGKLFKSLLTAHLPDWKERVDKTVEPNARQADLELGRVK